MAKKKPYDGLTILQQRFCEILFSMDEPNQEKAYIQAGYAPGGARFHASRLATKGNIQAYLQYLRDKSSDKAIIDKAKVLKEVAKLAFTNIGDYIDIENDEVYFKDFKSIPREQLDAVESVKLMRKIIKGKDGQDDVEVQQIGFKLYSKESALEKLMKHLGLYVKDNEQKRDNMQVALIDIIAYLGGLDE